MDLSRLSYLPIMLTLIIPYELANCLSLNISQLERCTFHLVDLTDGTDIPRIDLIERLLVQNQGNYLWTTTTYPITYVELQENCSLSIIIPTSKCYDYHLFAIFGDHLFPTQSTLIVIFGYDYNCDGDREPVYTLRPGYWLNAHLFSFIMSENWEYVESIQSVCGYCSEDQYRGIQVLLS